MYKRLLILISGILFISGISFAQQDPSVATESSYWKTGGGIGLNLDQLLVINPRAGAGENKFGFGGLGNFFANYGKENIAWDNAISLQLVFQKLGRNQASNPFKKTLDDLKLSSKIGYAITENKIWFVAIEGTFQSQLLTTYNGNYLQDVNTVDLGNEDNLGVLSKLLSPATITVTPGIDWKPNENFSVLFSPATMRLLIVSDDKVARLYVDGSGSIIDPAVTPDSLANGFVGSLHGNAAEGPNNFKNSDVQIGASVRAQYKNTFLDDRISFNTGLFLFYDYLGGQNGAINVPVLEWTTETGFNIYKGLSLVLATGLYYDYNKLVSKNWNKEAGAFESTGHGAMFTEALLIKYNFLFGGAKEK